MTKIFAIIFFFLVPVFVLPSSVQAAASDVVFTEIMYDLAGADADHEWVEIYNGGSEAVTIIEGSGNGSWRFNESSSNHTFTLIQGSLILAPGGVAVLAGDSAVFLAAHSGFSGTLIDTVMSLSNTSDTLKLSADKGATFFGEVVYQNTWGGNGDGKSLEKINPIGSNESTNWRISAADGGTPGSVTASSSTTATTTTPSGSTSQSTTGSGGSGSSSSTASAISVLKAEAGADVVIETNQPIAFSGLASQGAKTYKWYLGDGSVKDGGEITQTYQFPGTYLVTLEVGNGTDINIDQSRVFVFGGKVLVNEFFIGAASTTGQWLELYNPNNFSADISGWILESGETKFSAPNFVLIPAKGYLVLSQSVTGLDLSRSNKLQLKYPNGFIVDVVSFEKNKPEASANRSIDGFFWSKEPTPGRPNVIVSSNPDLGLNSSILPRLVLSKPQENPRILAAAAYNIVTESPADASNGENFYGNNPAISAQLPFWQKISKSILFWIFSTALLGAMISWGYIALFRKK